MLNFIKKYNFKRKLIVSTTSAFAQSFAPAFNIISGATHLILGGMLALSINKLAHQRFGIINNSSTSIAIKTVAFLAGTAACVCIAPYTPIFSLEFSQVIIATLANLVVATIAINEFPHGVGAACRPPEIYYIIALTALLPYGLFGRVGLIALGSSSAAFGAYLSDNL